MTFKDICNKIIETTEKDIEVLEFGVQEQKLKERYARRLLLLGKIDDNQVGEIQAFIRKAEQSLQDKKEYIKFLKEVREEETQANESPTERD
jgi:hypothetical protein